MNIKQFVEALDAQILSGDIVGAFNKFAADDCVTRSNAQDMTQNKAQKLEILKWFFQNIAAVNRIERLGVQVGDNVTESQFVFDFVNQQGQPLVYSEVIRRVWKDGKMVEEQYLLGHTLDIPKQTAAKKPSKKEAVKDVQPAAAQSAAVAKPVAAPKTSAPKASSPAIPVKTATPTAAKKASAKPDKTKGGSK
ncbi:MAG: hypothetical protein IPH12_00095 [Saprospirales bacterium]|jgi:arabinogalactan endo-1,4-beta-galactosidase|nr:hypothetical protein [Saprospirales bacterium]MBK8923972.1 hypothetical protein [Saprospirales bacterium]